MLWLQMSACATMLFQATERVEIPREKSTYRYVKPKTERTPPLKTKLCQVLIMFSLTWT